MAEQIIRDEEYCVNQPLAEQAIELKIRLIDVIGNGVDQIPLILKGMDANADQDSKLMASGAALHALVNIFSKSEPKKLIDFIKFALSFVKKKNSSGKFHKVDLNADFSGQLMLAYEVVFFAIKEVLGPFFTELKASSILEDLLEMA